MSIVEHPRDWTEQERLEWIKTYQGILDAPINNWIPEYEIEYKKKCCDNCEYFDTFAEFDSRTEDGICLKNVANDEFGEYIIYSNTFYCSHHKFKV